MIPDSYKLDISVLTTDELSGIIAALKGIGSVSEKSQVESTLNKLAHDPALRQRKPVYLSFIP